MKTRRIVTSAASAGSAVTSFVNGSPPWLRFALISACFLLASLPVEPYLAPLCRATAVQAGSLLGFLGFAPQVQGDQVTLSGFTVRIVAECTPLYACLLYAAFVLAQPASFRRTLTGLLTGALLIASGNLIRIGLVTAVGPVVSTLLFDIVHVYLGQIVMLMLVVAVCLLWLRWSAAGQAPFPFLVRACLIATALFLPWLWANVGYVKALDSLILQLFSLADYRLTIPHRHAVYYQTFNVVFLAALICAEQRFDFPEKLLRICSGMALLTFGHFLFRIGNVLMTAFDWGPAFALSTLLSVGGEYLLPVLCWRFPLPDPGPVPVSEVRS